jgi:hypothetical protein
MTTLFFVCLPNNKKVHTIYKQANVFVLAFYAKQQQNLQKVTTLML